MRTPEEIAKYYETRQRDDFLGFEAGVLIPYLPYELAKPWLKPDSSPEFWGEQPPLTEEGMLETMRDYMAFAWDKALNHRGISASRSVTKMASWLWLLGNDEMVAFCHNDANYENYGAPILKAICDKYGFPIPDDECARRMARGLPCYPGCDMGCGA